MQYKSLNDVDLSNKTVLLRSDLNTPIENGLVTNNERILRSLPTLNFIIDAGARLVIMSHLGRPEENDIFQEEFSLLPVVKEMENLLNKKIMFYNLGEFEKLDKIPKISVIEINSEGLLLTEIAKNWTIDDVQSLTEPKLNISKKLKIYTALENQ